MGREEDGHSFGAVELADIFPEQFAGLRIQARVGSSRKESWGDAQESAGNLQPAFHSAGKGFTRELQRSQSSTRGQQFLDPGTHGFFVNAYKTACSSMFSSAVSSSSRLGSWKTMPKIFRAASCSVCTSCPPATTDHCWAGGVVSILMVVLFSGAVGSEKAKILLR